MRNLNTAALQMHSLTSCNIVPVRGKESMIKWKEWQKIQQTPDDINSFDWNNATGFAVILNTHKLSCIDIDKLSNFDIIDQLLNELGLPIDYSWVVWSGSGHGAHLYFKIADPENLSILSPNPKTVYTMPSADPEQFDHIELRCSNCYVVFPPSAHPSGGFYTFRDAPPQTTPTSLKLASIISSLQTIGCIISPQSKPQTPKSSHEQIHDVQIITDAAEYIGKNLPSNSYDLWIKTGFALCPLGDTGAEIFLRLSQLSPHYHDDESTIRKKFVDLQQSSDGSMNIGTIFFIARSLGWQCKIMKFWQLGKNNKVEILLPRIKTLLELNGFCKIITSPEDTKPIHVRIQDNIITLTSSVSIKDFLLEYFNRIPMSEFHGTTSENVLNQLMKLNPMYFKEYFLEFLDKRNVTLLKDTANTAYFCYLNGFVTITAEQIKFNTYDKLPGCIWKSSILQRNFQPSETRSIVEEFFHNIAAGDTDRLQSLKSALGYLLHNYKKPTDVAAVILMDESRADGSHGRSGKGVTVKLLEEMRTVVKFDGRNMRFDKNFLWQRVTPQTAIVSIDDIPESFPFERIFSVLTDGMQIEEKGKREVYISHTYSPKHIFTTNFVVKGIDSSTLARQHIIEYSDHYNDIHTPYHEFGRNFIDDFTPEDRYAFDNFMLRCLQLYLQQGLIPHQNPNLDYRRIALETCPEFLDFTETIALGKKYNKAELHQSFIEEYHPQIPPTQRKFTTWLQSWATLKKYKLVETHSNKNNYITFIEKQNLKLAV